MIRFISREVLGVSTRFSDSRAYNAVGSKQYRLLDLLHKVDAATYLSGPAAKDYIEEASFLQKGIEIEWHDSSNYRIYKQLHGHFEHSVTILDLIFNTGPRCSEFIWNRNHEKS